MDRLLNEALDYLVRLLPTLAAIAITVAIVALLRRFIARRYAALSGKRYQQQLIMLAVYLLALLIIIISLPISDTLRGQLLSLIGIIISATIALSSTTFVGNAMAGIMLRILRNFHVGDFLSVGDFFGRVAETGLLHVEIQTEDRDLMTIPNLYLVTHPTKVILSSGTIVSARISLGYDTSWQEIEKHLILAAKETGLEEPFVQILELGDFSVSYQVNGLLTEVKHTLSTRSSLRKSMLDALHNAGIEIVSPTYMNTRAFPAHEKFIPRVSPVTAPAPAAATTAPEDMVFDIAEEAESLERLRERLEKLAEQVDEVKAAIASGEEEAERGAQRIEHLNAIQLRLTEIIERRQQEVEEGSH